MQVKDAKVENAASAKGKEGKSGQVFLWVIASLTREDRFLVCIFPIFYISYATYIILATQVIFPSWLPSPWQRPFHVELGLIYNFMSSFSRSIGWREWFWSQVNLGSNPDSTLYWSCAIDTVIVTNLSLNLHVRI